MIVRLWYLKFNNYSYGKYINIVDGYGVSNNKTTNKYLLSW